MQNQSVPISYEIDLAPGEQITLPPELLTNIGAGRWLITIQPAVAGEPALPVRNHGAFLNSYAPSDEGLYDDYTR